MFEVALAIALFGASYIVSVTFTSVFYHRALCHNALVLKPWLKKVVAYWGLIVTAVDPAIWVCTHRLHHTYSDTEKDPHSPRFNNSLLKINSAHFKYYARFNREFQNPESPSLNGISDLGFGLHPWMKLPIVPGVGISLGNGLVILIHLIIYMLIYYWTRSLLIPLALALGFLGHPIQGAVVNFFGHSRGYRNFETPDQSTNHPWVAWAIFGEGYQNNHHYAPSAVKFSAKKGEYDFGYSVCNLLKKLGWVSF